MEELSKENTALYAMEQLNFAQRISKLKPPKLQQFDLFYEYKEMEQLHTMRENSKKSYLGSSKALSARKVGPVNLPSIYTKTRESSVGNFRSTHEGNKETNPLPVVQQNVKPFPKLMKNRRASPTVHFRPIVKYRIEDPLPFNPFANKEDPIKVYKKAEYLSKLPVNPNVDIEAIERRIEKLMRAKAAKC